MSDIVERLRTRPTGDPYLHMMVHEAADEIERLRAEVEGLREVLANTRQALEQANTTFRGPICDTIWYSDHETLFDYIDAALAARKGEA